MQMKGKKLLDTTQRDKIKKCVYERGEAEAD